MLAVDEGGGCGDPFEVFGTGGSGAGCAGAFAEEDAVFERHGGGVVADMVSR